MENVVMQSLFGGVYAGRRILVTGHTGFKGSWLTKWLDLMGSEVYGYSLPPYTSPAHIDLIDSGVQPAYQDIRDKERLYAYFQEVRPEIVFHLAAQALVRPSYDNPGETFPPM